MKTYFIIFLFAAIEILYAQQIGDERIFIINLQGETRNFILTDISELHYLWVAENDTVPTDAINRLHEAIVNSTPKGSVNPEQGFLPNLHEKYGFPTFFSRDSIFHLLLFDMPGLQYGGFSPPWFDNADVIWIDSNELIFQEPPDLLLAAAAHEYAHLIHVVYNDLNNIEIVFIMEGTANFAMILNGYSYVMFSPEYLGYVDELNRDLFSWRGLSGDPTRRDYSRASLFFTYLATQFGSSLVSEIIYNSLNAQGGENLEQVLSQHNSSLKENITGFHTANFLNDYNLDSRYGYPDPALDPNNGYSFPELENIRVSDLPSSFALHVNGTQVGSTEEVDFQIKPGGVLYNVWENVDNFQLILNVDFAVSDKLSLHIIKVLHDDSIVITDPWSSGYDSLIVVPGSFKCITAAVVHGQPTASSINLTIAANWDIPTGVNTDIELPGTLSLDQNYPNPFNPSTTIKYSIPISEFVTLKVYDLLGREVATLVNEYKPAGKNEVEFDASSLSSGTYFYRLQTGEYIETKKLILLK